MASINYGRVVVGGLVGGVVANVIDMVSNMTFLKDDMAAMAQKFGMDPVAMQSMSAAVPWIIIDFVFGIVVIFTYAAMRPRFGAGPKTAMIAAFTLFVAVSAVLYGFTAMGMMSMGAYVRGTIEALVSTQLGALAGAAVYKEA
jgi:hypothetical protein